MLRLNLSSPLLLLAMVVSPLAQAHVTLATGEAHINSHYKAVLQVPHGCQGSPTTAIRVQIPDGMIDARPQPKPGWEIDLTQGEYDEPHELYGSKVESGVQEIAWQGNTLADEYYDEFVFTGYLSSDLEPGSPLPLPVVQECEDGTTRWIDTPDSDASSQDHSDTPAPVLKLLPIQQ